MVLPSYQSYQGNHSQQGNQSYQSYQNYHCMVLIDLYNPNFRYVRHVRGHVRQVALVMVRGQQMHLKNSRNV